MYSRCPVYNWNLWFLRLNLMDLVAPLGSFFLSSHKRTKRIVSWLGAPGKMNRNIVKLMDDFFLSFDLPLGRFKMFGVRMKSKSKKGNFITSGSADSRVVMFCEDIPSERSTDSGWVSQSFGIPSNVHRKEGQNMSRSRRPTKTLSCQKIHHMQSTFSGHNVGTSTLCLRDQYESFQSSITAGILRLIIGYMLMRSWGLIFVSIWSWGVACCQVHYICHRIDAEEI